MHKAGNIGEVWLKASILGSTWAASEIILGSFLHNLRVPFNGHILTAIALILLIAAGYKWTDKGMFWRSGLICALMKTMSPSAIIFGPMIAIFMESLLLELSVMLLGRNIAGFALGSALAMSWILVQKIFNFIIFYGFNIVEIYKDLMKYAEKQLHTSFDMVWTPIFFLLGIDILFGLLAVWIGVKIGRSILDADNTIIIDKADQKISFKTTKTQELHYSIGWLLADFVVLIGMMFVISYTSVYIWTVATIIVVFTWTSRYKRGMRQLSKPKFWIFFVIITMLSAFVITAIQGSANKWMEGLIIGLQMNFRAAIVIIGFSVLGTELYNPKIRNFFARTSIKQLPVALELAFESLPGVINNLPEVKSFFTQPATVIKSLIFQAEERLQTLKRISSKPHFIITGEVAGGKTRFIVQLIEVLKQKDKIAGGFYSPRVMQESRTIGYELIHIPSNEKIAFLNENLRNSKSDIGRFCVNNDAFGKVHEWLKKDANSSCDIIIIDEVGKWEMEGKGWKNEVESLLNGSMKPMIWTVRHIYKQDVMKFFDMNNAIIFDISETSAEASCNIILENISVSKPG